MQDKTLLVLAAGMGSRYGGLKQIDKLGPSGETIIDYSIYDALSAGFNKVVFVIRKSIEQDFNDVILCKYKDKIDVDYVLQEIENVPNHITYSPERKKPWGTGHAILMAKDKIKNFFAVINGDDLYGRNAFVTLGQYLDTLSLEKDKYIYSMVAYPLKNTLSENGTVSRGLCQTDEYHCLKSVKELTKLQAIGGKIINTNEDGSVVCMPEDAVVSMNIWGFHPSIFQFLEEKFELFLKNNADNPKSEFYIPMVVDELIQGKQAEVKVLTTDAQWYGVTYQEDRQGVVSHLQEQTNKGIYPSPLWK